MSLIKKLADERLAASDIQRCPNNLQVSCTDCRLSGLCLPLAMEDDDIVKLDEFIQRGRPLQRGEHLYRENDQFTSVYAVRSGALKTYLTTKEGEEQVTGFYLAGEIVGMDGLSKDRYLNSAKALETSAVCVIPFDCLEQLSTQFPSLQRYFFQLMANEIIEDQKLITQINKNTAEERVAGFLLSISARHARRQLSSTHFRLPMSRTDIGNYLGLTVETISRIMSRFSKQGLLRADHREIEIIHLQAMMETANVKSAVDVKDNATA